MLSIQVAAPTHWAANQARRHTVESLTIRLWYDIPSRSLETHRGELRPSDYTWRLQPPGSPFRAKVGAHRHYKEPPRPERAGLRRPGGKHCEATARADPGTANRFRLPSIGVPDRKDPKSSDRNGASRRARSCRGLWPSEHGALSTGVGRARIRAVRRSVSALRALCAVAARHKPAGSAGGETRAMPGGATVAVRVTDARRSHWYPW